MENKNLEVFSKDPVPQAVLKNVLPAMVAMLMVLISCFLTGALPGRRLPR